MAIEKTKTGAEIKAEAAKKGRKRRVFIGLDKTIEDVVQLESEGHDVYFEDSEDKFLELSSDDVAKLSPLLKTRYTMSKQIALGIDVIGGAVNGTKGYEIDYDIRPGSATDNLKVYGKRPGQDYTWVREDSLGRHKAEGWVVDHDPNVKTIHSNNESCTSKHVGGHARSELTLMRCDSKVRQDFKKKRKDIRMGRLKKSQDAARESILRAGAKVLD